MQTTSITPELELDTHLPFSYFQSRKEKKKTIVISDPVIQIYCLHTLLQGFHIRGYIFGRIQNRVEITYYN